MLEEVKKALAQEIAEAAGLDPGEVLPTLEKGKNEFGDLSSRIAFVLAAKERKNPVQVALELKKKLDAAGLHRQRSGRKSGKAGYIEKVETAGPYLNFYFSDELYTGVLERIRKEKEKFGYHRKNRKRIMVEFFDANTHKGVHIGHIRNICLGEAVCRLLEFEGNDVIRANYQGDIGPHVAKCLWGFHHLYQERAPAENRGTWLGKVYAEASQKIEGNAEREAQVKEIILKMYAKEKTIYALWKKTRQWCLDDFEKFYKELDVRFDTFYFESQTEGPGTQWAQEMLKRGIALRDQGAVVIDLKADDLGVFVLLTQEGYPLYSAKDLGLVRLKFDRYDLDRSIHVVGKEQELHFRQLFKTFEKIGWKKEAQASHHLIYELVMLPEGKMSSREGTMVLYADLKEELLAIALQEVRKRHEEWPENETARIAMEIALGALKFSMVRRENNKVLLFDWKQALNLEGDTGPHVQYAYVRTNGILQKAEESKLRAKIPAGYVFNADEKKLVKKMMEFPEKAEKSARDLAPSYIAEYLLELVALFNKFYTVSPVLTAEKAADREARLALVAASGRVLKSGLGLLDIPCPERM